MCSNVDDFTNRNIFLNAKLLKQGYRYHKIQKAFSKFFHRHSELIVNNIGLKTLLQQDISEPIFYGELIINSKELLGNLILVIISKRLSNVIKKRLVITKISCDSMHARFKPNHGL